MHRGFPEWGRGGGNWTVLELTGTLLSPCIRNPRPQCARQSKPCYPVNHLPFHRQQCISVVRKWHCCRSTPSKGCDQSLFARLTQINTLSIRFCRLLTLDSKISAWIRLRIVRKNTNNSQSTTAYVRILLVDNSCLLTKKLPLNGFLALY